MFHSAVVYFITQGVVVAHEMEQTAVLCPLLFVFLGKEGGRYDNREE